MNSLHSFFLQYLPFTGEEMDQVYSKFTKRALSKNEYLLRQGTTCRHFNIVTKGCIRLYYLKDDIEVSVWFAFPGSSAIEISSYISGNPSEYFLQSIEDSEVLTISKAEFEKLYETQTKLQVMMKNFWEDVVISIIDRFTSLQKDSAETRYRALLTNPGYLDRIPQKYLASYIGITPTSLSRIRRQISTGH